MANAFVPIKPISDKSSGYQNFLNFLQIGLDLIRSNQNIIEDEYCSEGYTTWSESSEFVKRMLERNING